MYKSLLVCVAVCCLALANDGEQQTFSVYETPLKIQYDGFPVEAHHVTTEDGYILEMHRIPHGRNGPSTSTDRPVVFLMHGLTSASNAFIALGPDYSFAYNLADAGYDIWMGNQRGSKNSRYHVSLDPDVDTLAFFDFTWEEIGMYDLPAMIDYILEYTGREKLHYIGHSQGGTVFLVLGSMRPEYNEKLASVHLLAGVGYQEYFPHEELSLLALTTDVIYSMALVFGAIELYPPNSTEIIALPGFGGEYRKSDYCTGNLETRFVCEAAGMKYIVRDDETTNLRDLQPGGGSLKQIAHYGQNIRDKAFRRYSHGLFSNMGIYGSVSPPAYNLSLITAQVTMHYTVNDNLLDERDVLAMANDMPNTIVRKVARETFLHEDFVATLDAKEMVTDYIIETIKLESGSSESQLEEVEDVENYEDDNNQEIDTDLPEPTPVVADPATDSASNILSLIGLIICNILLLLI